MFLFLIIVSVFCNENTYASTTPAINSQMENSAGILHTFSMDFDGYNKSYGIIFEVTPLEDIILYSLDIHTASKVTESIEVRMNTGSFGNFEDSEFTWTLLSNTTNLTGAELKEGYRTSIPMTEFSPILLHKDTTYSIYITLGTPTILSTANNHSKSEKIERNESSVRISEGLIVGQYPSKEIMGSFLWNGALIYRSAPSQDVLLPSPPLDQEKFRITTDVLTNALLSFTYKAPFVPISEFGKKRINGVILDNLNDLFEREGLSKSIIVKAINAFYMKDDEKCDRCFVISSVAEINHSMFISSSQIRAKVASLGPDLSKNTPTLIYVEPKLLSKNVYFMAHESSEQSQSKGRKHVEFKDDFIPLFENVMRDFLNDRLLVNEPPANIVSVTVNNPDTLEESPRHRVHTHDSKKKQETIVNTNNFRSSERFYNLDAIITGEFPSYFEDEFDALIRKTFNDHGNNFLQSLDEKLQESGMFIFMGNIEPIPDPSIINENKDIPENNSHLLLYISSAIILICIAGICVMVSRDKQKKRDLDKSKSVSTIITASTITRSNRSKKSSESSSRRGSFSWASLSFTNSSKQVGEMELPTRNFPSKFEVESSNNENELNSNLLRGTNRGLKNELSTLKELEKECTSDSSEAHAHELRVQAKSNAKPKVTFYSESIFQSNRSLNDKSELYSTGQYSHVTSVDSKEDLETWSMTSKFHDELSSNSNQANKKVLNDFAYAPEYMIPPKVASNIIDNYQSSDESRLSREISTLSIGNNSMLQSFGERRAASEKIRSVQPYLNAHDSPRRRVSWSVFLGSKRPLLPDLISNKSLRDLTKSPQFGSFTIASEIISDSTNKKNELQGNKSPDEKDHRCDRIKSRSPSFSAGSLMALRDTTAGMFSKSLNDLHNSDRSRELSIEKYRQKFLISTESIETNDLLQIRRRKSESIIPYLVTKETHRSRERLQRRSVSCSNLPSMIHESHTDPLIPTAILIKDDDKKHLREKTRINDACYNFNNLLINNDVESNGNGKSIESKESSPESQKQTQIVPYGKGLNFTKDTSGSDFIEIDDQFNEKQPEEVVLKESEAIAFMDDLISKSHQDGLEVPDNEHMESEEGKTQECSEGFKDGSVSPVVSLSYSQEEILSSVFDLLESSGAHSEHSSENTKVKEELRVEVGDSNKEISNESFRIEENLSPVKVTESESNPVHSLLHSPDTSALEVNPELEFSTESRLRLQLEGTSTPGSLNTDIKELTPSKEIEIEAVEDLTTPKSVDDIFVAFEKSASLNKAKEFSIFASARKVKSADNLLSCKFEEPLQSKKSSLTATKSWPSIAPHSKESLPEIETSIHGEDEPSLDSQQDGSNLLEDFPNVQDQILHTEPSMEDIPHTDHPKSLYSNPQDSTETKPRRGSLNFLPFIRSDLFESNGMRKSRSWHVNNPRPNARRKSWSSFRSSLFSSDTNDTRSNSEEKEESYESMLRMRFEEGLNSNNSKEPRLGLYNQKQSAQMNLFQENV